MNRDFAYRIEKKACSHCHEVKPLYEFRRKSKSHSGVTGKCICCIKATHKPTEIEILRQNLPGDNTRWKYG